MGESCGLQCIGNMKKKRTSSKYTLFFSMLFNAKGEDNLVKDPCKLSALLGTKPHLALLNSKKNYHLGNCPVNHCHGREDTEDPVTVQRVCVHVCICADVLVCWYTLRLDDTISASRSSSCVI